jgi:hypothetical protein
LKWNDNRNERSGNRNGTEKKGDESARKITNAHANQPFQRDD